MRIAEPLPFHADPVLAAIERHEEAYAAFQIAPEGEASMRASDEYDAALDALLAAACQTRPGAFCLLRHLRWWLAEEAEFAESYQPAYGIAQAREADLTLLLGCDGVQRIPVSLPSGRLPVAMPALPAPVSPVSHAAVAAEMAAACVLIVGGSILTGLSTLI